MKKVYGILIWAITSNCILGASPGYVSTKQHKVVYSSTDNRLNGNSNKESIIFADKGADVSSKEIIEKDEAINIDLKIPVIMGLDNKNVRDRINTVFESDALRFKNTIQKEADEALKFSKEKKIEFHRYSAETTFDIHYNKNGVLSITVMYNQYTGGAHGLEVMVGYTFDLQSGKHLKLSNLFDPSFDYKKIIGSEVLKAMKANAGDYFDYAISDFKGINEEQPYYIEEGNLVIFYGEYEIAPYAAGIPEFRIPLSKLKFHDTIVIK